MRPIMLGTILCILVLSGTTAQQQGYYWLIGDFHYDSTYWTTQESCNDNITHDKLGQYGDFECDAPWRLVKESVEAMVRSGPRPDFILFLGDIPHHPKNRSTSVLNTEHILDMIRNVTELIEINFPGVPVYPTLGNHDFHPHDQLPSENHPMYDAIADIWGGWINESDAQQTFKRGGFYSKLVNTNAAARVVVVNTNLHYTNNLATKGQSDPAGQFVWFDDVMTQAASRGEKVILILHIPLGHIETMAVYWLRPEYNAEMVRLIEKHADNIQAVYSGHQHSDTFHIFYRDGKPVTSLLLCPSVSPWRARIGQTARSRAHNPGVRRFHYNRDTLELMDIEQYFLELPKANAGEAEWRLEYGFRQSYGLQNASTGELQKLLDDFKQFASDNFHKYYKYNMVNTPHDSNRPCSCTCKQVQLCAIEFIKYDEYTECMKEDYCLTGIGGASRALGAPFVMVVLLAVVSHIV